jgi:CheY-like chemotaxis protein/putative methionine-R-sulfoxide reductase with GAF domain
MAGTFAIVLLITGVLGGALLLVFRLDLFSLRNRQGMGLFLGGMSLVAAALFWQLLTLSAGYADWFVPKAYTIAVILQALSAAAGVMLVSSGLVAHDRFWHTERKAVLRREQLLSMLENLQHDARQPYQLLELLNITLNEISRQMSGTSGALLFSNRTRRQYVLTASTGLAREEIASLEHYPFERNIVSQSVNAAEPLVAPGFDFVDADGSLRASRFNSLLVLPLVSGMEQIGALLLFSETPRRFDRSDAQVLTPVTEWLAERIRATRLTRELTTVRADRDQLSGLLTALHERFGGAVASLSAPDPLSAFCRSLAGLFNSSSAHLCAVRSGRVEFAAHSHPIGELSESYQTALIEAIDRRKPLMINQESTDDAGADRIIACSLVIPLGENHPHTALLLRRESGSIAVSDASMATVELLARTSAVAVDYVEARHRSITQRSGFERIMRLLDTSSQPDDTGPQWFVGELAQIFPAPTTYVVLGSGDDGNRHPLHALNADSTLLSRLNLGPRDGVGESAHESRRVQIFMTKQEIDGWLSRFATDNRMVMSQLIGADRERLLVANCLIGSSDSTCVLMVVMRQVNERNREEYTRLLTLACALYEFRNALSGRNQPTSPHDVASEFAPIEQSAMQSARLSDLLTGYLTRMRISGDLYMIAGRPREVHTRLAAEGEVSLTPSLLEKVIESALAELTAAATDDDVITASLYQNNDFVFLDLSRHRRHFPPVDRVADFAAYRLVTSNDANRFSQLLATGGDSEKVLVAVDSQSASPSFLSFKLSKSSATSGASSALSDGPPRILVIDDQAVILDLVSAMCQTIGYVADCARSGEIGLQMASQQAYSLVLVDLAMPGLSGIEVARLIHRSQPRIPVVIMTGWEATLDRAVLTEAGVVEILYKPFRIEQLTDLLKSSAGAHRRS